MRTAFSNIKTAIRMVHDLCAFWFLEKALQTSALRLLLERAVAQRRLASYKERPLSSRGVPGNLTGSPSSMREIVSLIRQVAPTPATVPVTGESGIGKELDNPGAAPAQPLPARAATRTDPARSLAIRTGCRAALLAQELERTLR